MQIIEVILLNLKKYFNLNTNIFPKKKHIIFKVKQTKQNINF